MLVVMNNAAHTPTGAAGIVSTLEATRKEQGRSLKWLSEKTGIPYSTLGYLKRNPARLRADDMITIAGALGLNWADLAARVAA